VLRQIGNVNQLGGQKQQPGATHFGTAPPHLGQSAGIVHGGSPPQTLVVGTHAPPTQSWAGVQHALPQTSAPTPTSQQRFVVGFKQMLPSPQHVDPQQVEKESQQTSLHALA
jgi:hypothetical protein